jgi:polyphenol oxidase
MRQGELGASEVVAWRHLRRSSSGTVAWVMIERTDVFRLENRDGILFFSCMPMHRDFAMIHAFSTRLGGVSHAPYAWLNQGFGSGDDRPRVWDNRRRFARAIGFDPKALVTLRQVHGDGVVVLTEGDDPEAARGTQADALITDRPQLPLAVITADCFPVLLVAPSHPVIGIVHSGRRGTAEEVVPRAVHRLCDRFGVRPGRVFVAIGPGIGGCCYEVDEASAAPFRARHTLGDGVLRRSRPHHFYLDLQEAIRLQLLALGVPSHHIWSANLCTACHPAWFYSYRREGARSGRMLNVAMIRP